MFRDLKKGITDPLDVITLPYLTTQNLVFLFLTSKFAEINSLSDASLDAPYKFIGLDALSVDKATTFFTLFSIHASITFRAPITLVFIHSDGFSSCERYYFCC